ncbi:MAG: hypothetical protein MJZ68_02770 [archaeon]|nr:hypothetical protein [archaeon]
MESLMSKKLVSVMAIFSLLFVSAVVCTTMEESSAENGSITSYYFKEYPKGIFLTSPEEIENFGGMTLTVLPGLELGFNTRLQYSQFEDGSHKYTIDVNGETSELSATSTPEGVRVENKMVLKFYMDAPSEEGTTTVYTITGYFQTGEKTITITVLTPKAGTYYVSTSDVVIGLPEGWTAPEGKILSAWTNKTGTKTYEIGNAATNGSICVPVYVDAGINGTLTTSGTTSKVTVSATVGSSQQSGTMIGLIIAYENGQFINTFVDATYGANFTATANFQFSSIGLKSVLIEVVDGSTLDGETKALGTAYEKILTPSS